jgi:hypothetical protein
MKVNLWCACLLVAALPAMAQDGPVGQVKNASGKVELVRGTERLTAKPGDEVRAKDLIETGADGSIGVTLIDNTVLSAGPNSQLALEEYSFNSSNFTGAMTADLRKGTLAVVSGDIAKSSPAAMKVRTPTAILGVRGTQFAVQVGQ